MRSTHFDNYATRVETHCDRAKVCTFMCEEASAEGDFATAETHAKDAIAELQNAIAELTAILPDEAEATEEPEIEEHTDGRDFDEPYATEPADRIYGI